MLGALLFVFSRHSWAAASETTLSQRVQNSALVTSGNSVTGTYGESLTVTLRFTVTTNTVLTGPVQLTTRFPGIIAPPNSQLSLRFVGYQNPITAALGTPPLSFTSFASSTIGAAPNASTLVTWTFGAITNTSGSSYVYEVPYQVRYVWDGVADSTTNVTLAGNQTSLIWGPGGANNTKTAPNNLTINLIKPDLGPSYSTATYRLVPAVQGGALVVFTTTIKNGNSPLNFIPAYDLVVTDSLDANLTYVEAFPAPTGVSSVPGQNTIITWTSPAWTLAPNASWTANVTATLPPTLTANTRFTNTILPAYTTQPGNALDEATLTATLSAGVFGGVAASLQAAPNDNLRIGDMVTYTTRITLNQNVSMLTPTFSDTLAPGFHYRSGSLAVSGDAVLSGAIATSTAGLNEVLSWQIADWSPIATTRVATITYIADLTGLNANGTLAYASSAADFTSKRPGANSLQATWRDDQGQIYSLLAPLAATVQIIQPYLNNADFGTSISAWIPNSNPQEIDSIAVYTFSVRNTGLAPAYDIAIDDVLPPGLAYAGNLIVPIGTELWYQPSVGDTGALHFSIKSVAANAKVTLQFYAQILNSVRPGDALDNQVNLLDYSTQPNGLYDGNANDNDYAGAYDRHYGNIPIALPAPKSVTFSARGLIVATSDAPDPVLPGQLLVYSLQYSNTSGLYVSNNTLITHTYDSLLAYVGSSSSPDIQGTLQNDPAARTLTWTAGDLGLNASSNSRITVTFQASTAISRSVKALTSTITSDSSSPSLPVARIVTTTLVQPKPSISLDDKGVTVTANNLLTYTMIYSNASAATGATTGTFTITLDYDPHVTFITSTGRLPVPGTGGRIFTDTLGAGMSRTVALRTQVAQPLPYTLTSITSAVTIDQPDVDISAADDENTPVVLPIFDLLKTNTTPGNPPVQGNSPIGYRIYVTNTGPITGINLVITDVWDANTYNQNASGNWGLNGAYGVYTTLASLAPGASVILDPLNMNVTPTLASNVQSIHNIAQLRSRDTTEQLTSYDTPIIGIYIQKSHQPTVVFPGEVLTYSIDYSVLGSPAVSPVITDTLPPEVTYLACYGAEHCAQANGKVTWNWGALSQNATGVVTVVVQAPTTEWITLTNNYASDSVSGAAYREGVPDLTYVGRPHLALTKRATTAVTPVAPGDLITYTLLYTNSGSYKSTGTSVQDALPGNVTLVDCAGAPCGESAGQVTWVLAEVPVTTTETLTMVVRVNPDAGNTIISNNTYLITADRNVAGENVPVAATTSVVRPALSVVKTAAPTWIALGGSITYTVRYTNTGGGTFTSLYFTDTLDGRTAFVSASPNCVNHAGTVNCTDSGLTPGQSRQITLTAQSISLSNGDVVTNAAAYVAANQTEALPVAMSNLVEAPASNAGAAADFVGAPLTGAFPLAVTFTNLASGNGINSYLWNFGDGATSTSSATTVPHIYTQLGVYTVSLTVNTDTGNHTRVRPAYISATGAQILGVGLTAPYTLLSGLQGEVVTYTLDLMNTGNVPDSFDLATTGNFWNTSFSSPAVGPLSVGASAAVVVSVTIPPNSVHNTQDFATIKATSETSPSVSSSLVLTTTMYDPAQGFFLSPAQAAFDGKDSEVIQYTLQITNNSKVADSFALALNGNTWPSAISTHNTGLLGFNASASIVVSVTVQQALGQSDTVTVTATSNTYPTVQRTSQLTTKVQYRVFLPIVVRQ